MAIQKKHGKGRLDKWYKLAKEKGYRARAAFKLIQLNKKFGFLEKSKVILDLCAAPGSWCQVASETAPQNSLIIGVDLAPIKPIPKVITFQSDITTEKCRATIRGHLKTWKADTVMHDGAPNVGTAWIHDSYSQAELVLHSLKLATEFLIEGGTFVTKVFRSKQYNQLLWVFNQLFNKVDATKPPSSRNVSAEIFVVCRGFKSPKRIDPRLLDPRSVFEDLAEAAPNNEAKVYNPEIKKRKREGYEEGEYIQFKEVTASEFIQTTDPIAILGQYNRLSFDQPKNGDVALAALDKLPETTAEIRNCCADLKVLGRKDFKLLLRWRLKVREIFGFPTKKTAQGPLVEEVAEVESMDEEMRIQKYLQDMKDKENSKKKRAKRRENERKTKEINRLNLDMITDMDLGKEQEGPRGEGALFGFKTSGLVNADSVNKVSKGKMVKPQVEAKVDHDSGLGSSAETDEESDEEEDRLERELDNMYDRYQERKFEADAKYRAKKARKEHADDEWEGVSASEQSDSDDEELEEESSDESDDDFSEPLQKPLLRDLDNTPSEVDGLSKRARNFFSQGIFQDIDMDMGEDEEEQIQDDDEYEDENEIDDGISADNPKTIDQDRQEEDGDSSSDDGIPSIAEQKRFKREAAAAASKKSQKNFEVVKQVENEDDWEDVDRRQQTGKPNIELITAEAMTLAQQLATGQRTKADIIDEGFNKRAFKDRDGLPDWFLDDESKHDKPHKPITKAAADAIKEKMRALNARPIKKVREAKARKKFKMAQKLEKLKKKSDLLAADENLTEKDKATTIAKLMSKAARSTKQHRPVKVIKAAGANRGLKGRPKGIKGRYKMVDPRMKKEMRALKRIAKKKK